MQSEMIPKSEPASCPPTLTNPCMYHHHRPKCLNPSNATTKWSRKECKIYLALHRTDKLAEIIPCPYPLLYHYPCSLKTAGGHMDGTGSAYWLFETFVQRSVCWSVRLVLRKWGTWDQVGDTMTNGWEWLLSWEYEAKDVDTPTNMFFGTKNVLCQRSSGRR